MKLEVFNFCGWPNTLRLFNDTTELVVTTDVGPRILSYRTGGRGNIFHTFEEQMGGSGEADWKIRGGHRLWLAPEDEALSYHADNGPVTWRHDEDLGEVVLESVLRGSVPVRKTLRIRLASDGSRVTVRHTVFNEGTSPARFAPWALSVMRPDGIEIIPQPPLGVHPRDLLPNRSVVLWPYTDLSDTRWTLGTNYWFLRQSKGALPTKLGLAHGERWVGYWSGDLFFIKEFELVSGESYPDGGCNFETYADAEILEIESLGPLKTLHPGDSATHEEHWGLYVANDAPPLDNEAALGEWLAKFPGVAARISG